MNEGIEEYRVNAFEEVIAPKKVVLPAFLHGVEPSAHLFFRKDFPVVWVHALIGRKAKAGSHKFPEVERHGDTTGLLVYFKPEYIGIYKILCRSRVNELLLYGRDAVLGWPAGFIP